MPTPDQIQKTVDNDTFTRAFKARLDIARMTGEQLVDEHRHRAAEALLAAGLTLIPSEHLLDNQFVVSRGVYEAALKLSRGG